MKYKGQNARESCAILFFNFLWFEKAYFKNDPNQKNANGQGKTLPGFEWNKF